jgi:hypothetical protein
MDYNREETTGQQMETKQSCREALICICKAHNVSTSAIRIDVVSQYPLLVFTNMLLEGSRRLQLSALFSVQSESLHVTNDFKISTRKSKKLGIPECRCTCIIGMMGAYPCQAIHQDLVYAMTLEAYRNQPRYFSVC